MPDGHLPQPDEALRPQRLPLLSGGDLAAPSTFNLRRVLLHNPALAAAWSSFATHVLFNQSLPWRDREIAMLRIGWLNKANYEWCQHVKLARKAGLSDAEIKRVSAGDRAGWPAHEAAVLAAVDELFGESTVSDATWAALTAHYSTAQVLDLIYTIGQYNLVSWFLNATGVPLDEGLKDDARLNV